MALPHGFFVPLHRDGWKFVAIFALAAFGFFFLWQPLGWLGVAATLWCAYFFRDPPRICPVGADWVLSPADGVVSAIAPAAPPPEIGLGEAPLTRISVFMDVFNVHVNRSPADGQVAALAYRPGKFFNASFDKASIHNERMSIRLRPEGEAGQAKDLAVVQIAGLVARRIVCDLAQGEGVHRGARFGIIRFGSRVDVYLPPGAEILVQPGITTRAGETILARFV